MSSSTQDDDVAEAEDYVRSTAARVTRLRKKLEELERQLEAGQETQFKDVDGAVNKISEAISRCHKAEMHLNDCRKQRDGAEETSQDIDFEEARNNIGCQLSKLRCTAHQ